MNDELKEQELKELLDAIGILVAKKPDEQPMPKQKVQGWDNYIIEEDFYQQALNKKFAKEALVKIDPAKFKPFINLFKPEKTKTKKQPVPVYEVPDPDNWE